VVTVDVMDAARDDYLRRLRHAYATDRITVDELDALTGHVLDGGHLTRRLEAVADPDPRSSLAAVLRRGGGRVVVDYSERRWRL
jgi:hypothetical protein